MTNLDLLTSSNPKTLKGIAKGYLTFVLHLAPARLSGYEVCQWRTRGCTSLCLNVSGHAGIFKEGEKTNAIQECRKRRTRMLFEDRETFLATLVADIERAIKYARKHRKKAVFRLNGTSDLLWENIPVTRDGKTYENIFKAFPKVQFYDYTKAPYAMRRHDIPNYHLTFSFAETIANHLNARQWYAKGHSVSVVFGITKDKPLPKTFAGAPVYNADENDLRFLDSQGVAGLHAKGTLWKEETTNDFVIRRGKGL